MEKWRHLKKIGLLRRSAHWLATLPPMEAVLKNGSVVSPYKSWGHLWECSNILKNVIQLCSLHPMWVNCFLRKTACKNLKKLESVRMWLNVPPDQIPRHIQGILKGNSCDSPGVYQWCVLKSGIIPLINPVQLLWGASSTTLNPADWPCINILCTELGM